MAYLKRTTKVEVSSNSSEEKIIKDIVVPGKDCVYGGKYYGNGSVVTQKGVKMQCNGGEWYPLTNKVTPDDSYSGKGTGKGKK